MQYTLIVIIHLFSPHVPEAAPGVDVKTMAIPHVSYTRCKYNGELLKKRIMGSKPFEIKGPAEWAGWSGNINVQFECIANGLQPPKGKN